MKRLLALIIVLVLLLSMASVVSGEHLSKDRRGIVEKLWDWVVGNNTCELKGIYGCNLGHDGKEKYVDDWDFAQNMINTKTFKRRWN